MPYKELIQKQIRELEEKIEMHQGEKLDLVKELNRLRLAEFEEDMRTSEKQLLKG
jgi:hypothetical protein